MARRTKEAAGETRNAILDAAERLFSERGVSRTSLADIAGGAGVTRGAVYWHFRNKADLFEAMLHRVTLPMDDAIAAEALIGRERDPLGAVRNCMCSVLHKTATDPQAQRVFEIVCHKCEYVDEMDAVRARYTEMREQWLAEMERDFRAAVRAGQLPRTLDTRFAAVAAHAFIDGLINSWLIDMRFFSLKRDAERLVDLFLAGLTAGGKSAGAGSRAPTKAPAKKKSAVRMPAAR